MERLLVPPPTLTSTRFNLKAAANLIENPGERWVTSGIKYEPHDYNRGGSLTLGCGFNNPFPETTDRPDVVEWDPYEIWWDATCENFVPASVEQLRLDARAGLLLHQSDLLETAFWDNTVMGADYGTPDHPNVGLASAAGTPPTGAQVVTAGPTGVVPAFQELVGAMGDALNGVRGMIHVPERLIPLLDFYGLVVIAGNQRLAGSTDHILVGGSGYSGSGPGVVEATGDNLWIYGTSPVELRLGTIEVEGLPSIFNRATDVATARARQPALASWDRQVWVAAEVCMEDPGPPCGS